MSDQSAAPAPYYQAHVFVCTNEREPGHPRGCCRQKGGDDLRDYMKKKATGLGLGKQVRINNAGCLDRCELGPVMVIYPEGIWYSVTSRADVDEVLQTHLVEGRRVQRLMLYPADRLPTDIAARRTDAS